MVVTTVENYINGSFQAPATGEFLDVLSPADLSVVGKVAVSDTSDVAKAVDAASQAFLSWSSMTTKARAAIMMRFHALIREHAQELAELIVLENGKNITEALADVAKGNETVVRARYRASYMPCGGQISLLLTHCSVVRLPSP
jgi:malonate-semialdehyde dehydrogenase (acetylating)/methylmalonate-semialdehyde dehydrogenase